MVRVCHRHDVGIKVLSDVHLVLRTLLSDDPVGFVVDDTTGTCGTSKWGSSSRGFAKPGAGGPWRWDWAAGAPQPQVLCHSKPKSFALKLPSDSLILSLSGGVEGQSVVQTAG